jgi:hypothetical protein
MARAITYQHPQVVEGRRRLQGISHTQRRDSHGERLGRFIQSELIYPKPHIFDPERFLKDGKLDQSVQDPEDRVFGSARRICPGRHFANRTIFLRIATILATFDIGPGANDKGEVESEVKFREGIVR